MRPLVELTRHLPFDRSMEKHAQLAPGVFCRFALSLIASRTIDDSLVGDEPTPSYTTVPFWGVGSRCRRQRRRRS